MVENGKNPPLEETSGLLPEDASLIYRLLDRPPSELAIERIANGETNKNFVVQGDGFKYVVRIPYKGADIVDQKRKFELGNLRTLLENPTTARVVPCYKTYVYLERSQLGEDRRTLKGIPNGTAITEYIEGFDLTAVSLKDDEVRKVLVRTLHAFHTSGVRFTNPYDPFVDEIANYRRKAEESSAPFILLDAKEVKRIDSIVDELKIKLPEDSPTSTHNDLVFGNLRMGKNGKLYLLDFEYAGSNNRGLHYDFGTLFGENIFSDNPMTKDLFEKILDQASKTYGAKFDLEKTYHAASVNMIVTLWYGVLKHLHPSDEKERQYFSQYVKDRMEKIFQLPLNI